MGQLAELIPLKSLDSEPDSGRVVGHPEVGVPTGPVGRDQPPSVHQRHAGRLRRRTETTAFAHTPASWKQCAQNYFSSAKHLGWFYYADEIFTNCRIELGFPVGYHHGYFIQQVLQKREAAVGTLLTRGSHRRCLFLCRVQSQFMGTILNGVVGMTSRPLPVYLVLLADLIKLVAG